MTPDHLHAPATVASLWTAFMLPCFAAYVVAQLLIIAYSSHRYLVLWRWWRTRRDAAWRSPPAAPDAWPRVTVQVPLYNEPAVACRVIEAVAAIDYPRDRLEIQILDDSNDETTGLARSAAAACRRRGIDVAVHHREVRRGFKAGALAAGLDVARGELVAVFDADFVPPPDFLRRLVPHFAEPSVGMVQGRWGHLNRGRSMLTEAQAVMLDAHFLLEHEARAGCGLFFNFNGTAGIWRRECIADSGGWSSDTLTEDLDLSYRAQLAGWRFVFDASVECPAELPDDIGALKTQQRRWTKGSIQTALKILPRVWASDARGGIKLEAFFHLTSNLTYPLLLGLAALMLPVMLTVPPTASWLGTLVQIGVLVFGVLPVALFLAAGQARTGGRSLAQIVFGAVAALLLGIGLSVNNTRAALEGFRSACGDWERTPKTGDVMARPIVRGRGWRARSGGAEMALAGYFAALAVFAESSGHGRALPFILLLLLGFSSVGWASRRGTVARA